MSKHSNEARTSAPTAPSRSKIKGHNSTYLSAVQKNSKDKSSTKPAGKPKVGKVMGEGSAPKDAGQTAMADGFHGHYKPNRG